MLDKEPQVLKKKFNKSYKIFAQKIRKLDFNKFGRESGAVGHLQLHEV